MGLVALLVSTGLLATSLFMSRKKPLSPEILFFSLWTFILMLSSLNLYGIYRPSAEAYALICIMLVCFYIGIVFHHLLVRSLHLDNVSTMELCSISSEEPRYIPIYCFYLFSIFLLLIDCIFVVNGVHQGIPLWQIHGWHMESFATADNPMMARRSFVEQTFRSTIIEPFQLLIPPLAAFVFFDPALKGNSNRRNLLVLSAMDIVLSTVAGGGGRLGLVYYLLCFALAFLVFQKMTHAPSTNSAKEIGVASLRGKTGKNRKNRGIGFAIAVVAMILLIVAATQSRVGSGSMIKQIYTYFALPPTLLSLYLPVLQETPHTFGMLSLYGFVGYFFLGMRSLGLGTLVPDLYDQAYQQLLNVEDFKDVGYGVANAFVTPIYSFYVDGGVFFVIFASMFAGFVVSYFFVKFVRKPNIQTFAYYAFIMNGVFLTMIRVQTNIPTYVIAFLIAWVLLKPRKILLDSSDIDRSLEQSLI